ncbi:hypothetical protein [Aminiphilus sp.]|uniref:hypothetical protein n=1 Tax=Aminiphilus sp. TaxID=1872488 RepID=UPI0026248960|nr:hypothetical protein [Aminiphilus sp.]
MTKDLAKHLRRLAAMRAARDQNAVAAWIAEHPGTWADPEWGPLALSRVEMLIAMNFPVPVCGGGKTPAEVYVAVDAALADALTQQEI